MWSLFLTLLVSVVVFFYCLANGYLGFMPTFEQLENPNIDLAAEVYSCDSVLLGKFYYKENRSFASYSQLKKFMEPSLVSTEDVRFEDHPGIDLRSLFRVVKGVVTGNSSAGGGSTISQQLAKMLFPRDPLQNKFQIVLRKFKEWVIAVKLEKNFTKEEILTLYLNKFDFINNATGIKSAAQVYFNTDVENLRLEQAAMLVGMHKNPSLYNPLRKPKRTLKRRNVVLYQLYNNDYLDRQQYDSLKLLPLGLDYKKVDHNRGLATYFREYLRTSLTAKKPEKSRYFAWQLNANNNKFIRDSLEWETNPFYGWCNKNKKEDGKFYSIYNDGLKIYTTIHSKLQKYAEEAMNEHLSKSLQITFDSRMKYQNHPPFSNDITKKERQLILKRSIRESKRYKILSKNGADSLEIVKNFDKPIKMRVYTWNGDKDTIMSPLDSIKYRKSIIRSSFMSIEPKTGYVRVYVGGPNHKYFQYDMVKEGKRQVGSTFKPILYTLVMQNGLTPCTKVPNIPITFRTGSGPWVTRPTKKHEGKIVTLEWGLAKSENSITGWVLKQTNVNEVTKMARKMGIQSYVPKVPSICLGVADISLNEMVGAYNIFASQGIYTKPIYVNRIEDKNGNVITRNVQKQREVISEKTSYLMLKLLEGVVRKGTGLRLRTTYYLNNQIGGKTGTTQNQSDGWFMGIIPKLVSGVWTGWEDRSIHFEDTYTGQGANMALPIWALFIKKVYADPSIGIKEADTFKIPNDLRGVNFDCDSVEQKPNNQKSGEDDEEDFF